MEIKKILVLGDEASDKETALKQICSDLVITESASYGKTIMNNMKIHIFSPSGADRFKFMQEVLSVNINGAIIFIDSIQTMNSTCMEMINFVKEKNVPCVIVANNQDPIEKHLQDISKFTVIPACAVSGEGVNQGFSQLLDFMESEDHEKVKVLNS